MQLLDSEDSDLSRDAVTGLPGREAALVRLGAWLDGGATVQGILIGLRRFDAINMAYGSAAGDRALAEVAVRLKAFAGGEIAGPWLAARNGSQFLLLSAEPCSRERWQWLCARLLDGLARSIPLSGVTLRLSPRGALLRGLSGESAESMLDRLGQTLANALTLQGRRLIWADGEAIKAGRSAADLEADLLQALDRGEIEVVYQPQFACAGGALSGAEALARWNHPLLGRIGAGGLFSIAERADHIAPLSRHIARLALAGARSWPDKLRLSLNVTPSDLAAANFAEQYASFLHDSGFPARRLTLEVTEQVLVSDIQHAAQGLESLASIGVRIALDDFGAGFCNFHYLKLLPLHYLKLDRSMIEGVTENPRDLAVLRGIIAMAGALDLQVIVEGIETPEQLEVATTERCAFYQGFLSAQPMSAEEFAAFAIQAA